MHDISGGGRLAKLRLAVKNGKEDTDFAHVVAFGQNAEFAAEFLHTGDQIGIQGRWHSAEWTSKEGHKRESIEVVVSHLTSIQRKQVSPRETSIPAVVVAHNPMPDYDPFGDE